MRDDWTSFAIDAGVAVVVAILIIIMVLA